MSGPITTKATFCIVASSRGFAWMLGLALRLETFRLRVAKREWITLKGASRKNAEVLLYAFTPAVIDRDRFVDEQAAVIARDAAKVKIFLQLATPTVHGSELAATDARNRNIESLARKCGGHIVMTSDLMQTGAMPRMKKSGKPNLYGYASIAHVALRAIKAQVLRATLRTRTTARGALIPSGARSAQALPSSEDVLGALAWNAPALPANLWATFTPETILDFVERRVFFPSFRSWGKFPLPDPIDWSMAGANWSWQSYFTGLEFLRPSLAYWHKSVSGLLNDRQANITATLSAHGMEPNDLFRRVGFIIADFVRNNPPTQPKNQRAFFQGTICRRVKVFLTYLVCVRKAKDLGIAVDPAEFALLFQGLTDSLELLRSDEVYPVGGNHGVRQDALFIVAGLLLHKLPYGRELLRLGMERLEKHQVGRAISADGVWLENSFGYHCLIMNQFCAIAADLRMAGRQEADRMHAVLRRLWPFAEAMIKCDGYGPLLGDTAPRRQFSIMAEVSAELAHAKPSPGDGRVWGPVSLKTFERAKDTYFFPAGGYFASHTAHGMDPTSSQMIAFANLSRPKHKQADDISVLFSRGPVDFLVDGGTYNKEISDTVRNAARYDPASHNSFRINGAGYPVRAPKHSKPAGLSAMWEGEGWAAVRAFNTAYAGGRIERFAIHLKRQHAVIVLDHLVSKGSAPALFEQFWHIHPDFIPPKDAGASGPWTFASKADGNLLVAFDEGTEAKIEFGGPNNPIAFLMLKDDTTVPTPYLRRTLRTPDGTMASLFQSSDRTEAIEIALTPGAGGTTEIAARGVGFACRFVASEKTVECLALDQRE